MSLGSRLKKERENKDLTLSQISEKLRIPREKLEALENDDYSVFEGIFYAKKFLKSYADFLDVSINSVELQKIESKSKSVYRQESTVPESPKRSNLFQILLFLLLCAVIVWGLTDNYRYKSGGLESTPEKSVRQNYITEIENAVELPEIYSGYSVFKNKLMAKAVTTESTWVQVVTDQELFYQGMLRANTTFYWEAEEQLFIKVGYIPGVDIYFRENDREDYNKVDMTPGSRGDINEVEFTK